MQLLLDGAGHVEGKSALTRPGRAGDYRSGLFRALSPRLFSSRSVEHVEFAYEPAVVCSKSSVVVVQVQSSNSRTAHQGTVTESESKSREERSKEVVSHSERVCTEKRSKEVVGGGCLSRLWVLVAFRVVPRLKRYGCARWSLV